MPHKQEDPVLTVRKFLQPYHLNFPNYNPLDYDVWGLVERDPQNSVQDKRWTQGKENGSIYQFQQGDRQKGLREIPKYSGSRGWSQ